MSASSAGSAGNMLQIVSPSSHSSDGADIHWRSGNVSFMAGLTATSAPDLPARRAARRNATAEPIAVGKKINALFCDWHAETMTFGRTAQPRTRTFQDSNDPAARSETLGPDAIVERFSTSSALVSSYRVLVGRGLVQATRRAGTQASRTAKRAQLFPTAMSRRFSPNRVKEKPGVSRISPDSDHDSGGREIEDA